MFSNKKWILLALYVVCRFSNANATLTSEDIEQIRAVMQENVDMPIGIIMPFAGSASVPNGYVECNGQKLSTTDPKYHEFFSVIGYAFTPESERGDKFRVPDLRGKVPLGAGKGVIHLADHSSKKLTQRDLGQEFGEEVHSLSESEMPKHKHELTNTTHTHLIDDKGHSHSGAHGSSFLSWTHAGEQSLRNVNGDQYVRGFQINGVPVPMIGQTAPSTSNLTVQSNQVPMGMKESGNGEPHNNMQPSLVIRYIIKYKGSLHGAVRANSASSGVRSPSSILPSSSQEIVKTKSQKASSKSIDE